MVLGGLLFGAAKLFENTLLGTSVRWMDEPMIRNGAGIIVTILIVLGVFVFFNLIIPKPVESTGKLFERRVGNNFQI